MRGKKLTAFFFLLSPVEKVMFCYAAFMSGVMAVSYRQMSDFWPAFLFYLGMLGVIPLVSNLFHPQRRNGTYFLYLILFYAMVVGFYFPLGSIIADLHPGFYDHVFHRADQWLFGFDPLIMMQTWIRPWLTDMMELFYNLYYVWPLLIMFWLHYRKKDDGLEATMTMMGFNLCTNYVWYLLVPVIGPRLSHPNIFDIPLQGGLIRSGAVAFLSFVETTPQNCFPSGHTSISLIVLYCAYRWSRGLFWLILIPITLLIASTMYLRHHYVVDVIAGITAAAYSIIIAHILIKKSVHANN